MTQQQRTLLAIALAFGLTLVYSKLVLEPQAEQRKAQEAALLADAGTLDGGVAAAGPTLAQGPVAAPALVDGGSEQAIAPSPELPAREVKAHRATTDFAFQSVGGGLSQATLLEKKEREQGQISLGEGFKKLLGGKLPPSPQMDLGRPSPGLPLPFSVTLDGAAPLPADTRWEVAQEGEGLLVLKASKAPWEVTRTFRWKADGYELSSRVEVKNVSQTGASGELGFHVSRAIEPGSEQKGSFLGGIGNESSAICRAGDDTHKKPPSDKPPEEFKGAIHFFGVDQQYFLSAGFPLGGARDGRCVLTSTPTVRAADAYFPVALQPGQSMSYDFGGFLGPKDLELLTATLGSSVDGAAATVSPQLEKAVDFGWWEIICKLLLSVLKFFHRWGGNWGVAIILLTVSVKLILLPLTHRAMVSAEAMKKLQPRLEEIRKKFPDDRERQNLEMMKLYQEAKVNPLGGCLPLLLQLPVWAALFTTLRTSYELYGEPFIGPVWTDLTYKDPTYILPLALGVTMIITQRLQPQVMDATQAKIMTWFMPIFFTAIMLNYPAGLSLYIFTNNLLSIAQQFLLRRYLSRKGATST